MKKGILITAVSVLSLIGMSQAFGSSVKEACGKAVKGEGIQFDGKSFSCDKVEGAHEAGRNVLAVCEGSPDKDGVSIYSIEVSDREGKSGGRFLSLFKLGGASPDMAPELVSETECK